MFRKAINLLAAFSLAATALVAGVGSALADSYPNVTQIVASDHHFCDLSDNGQVQCWGENVNGETVVPQDLPPSKFVAVGPRDSCSVSTSGYITCWGNNFNNYLTVPRDFGKVQQIALNYVTGCAITEFGNVKCWGSSQAELTFVPTEIAQTDSRYPVRQITMSGSKACALTWARHVVCWGSAPWDAYEAVVPANLDSVTSISMGDALCADSDGDVKCYGAARDGELVPANLGKLTNLTGFYGNVCGVTPSATLRCWRFVYAPEFGKYITEDFQLSSYLPTATKVATTLDHVCFITKGGQVRCSLLGSGSGSVQSRWWSGFSGQVLPPLKSEVSINNSFTDNGRVVTYWTATFDPWQEQTSYVVTQNAGGVQYPCSSVVTYEGITFYNTYVECDVTGLTNGLDYTFTLTGTNPAGSVTSDTSPVFTPLPRWNQIGTPAITGNVVLGRTLTADTGTWDPVPSFNYQWLRNGNAISGANGQNYTLGFDDLGADISVTVTSAFPMLETKVYTTDSVHLDLANGVVVIPNSPCAGAAIDSSVWMGGIKQPAFTGQAVYGQTLNGTTGSWPAKTKLCSFWYSNGQAIPGAFSKTLKLSGTSFGRQVQYVVVGTDSKGVSVMRYTNAITISNTTFTKATPPAIKGTMKVGSVLQSSVKAWDAGVTYSYQWLRGGQPIDGATAATYTLTGNDLNAKISVQVCGTKPFFNDLCLVSASGTAVVAGVFSPAPKVLLQGSSTKIGSSFVASVSSYPNDADVAIQWLRDGAPIAGQTGSTYTVVQADKGHSINVAVTISKLGYVTFSKSGIAKKIS